MSSQRRNKIIKLDPLVKNGLKFFLEFHRVLFQDPDYPEVLHKWHFPSSWNIRLAIHRTTKHYTFAEMMLISFSKILNIAWWDFYPGLKSNQWKRKAIHRTTKHYTFAEMILISFSKILNMVWWDFYPGLKSNQWKRKQGNVSA